MPPSSTNPPLVRVPFVPPRTQRAGQQARALLEPSGFSPARFVAKPLSRRSPFLLHRHRVLGFGERAALRFALFRPSLPSASWLGVSPTAPDPAETTPLSSPARAMRKNAPAVSAPVKKGISRAAGKTALVPPPPLLRTSRASASSLQATSLARLLLARPAVLPPVRPAALPPTSSALSATLPVERVSRRASPLTLPFARSFGPSLAAGSVTLARRIVSRSARSGQPANAAEGHFSAVPANRPILRLPRRSGGNQAGRGGSVHGSGDGMESDHHASTTTAKRFGEGSHASSTGAFLARRPAASVSVFAAPSALPTPLLPRFAARTTTAATSQARNERRTIDPTFPPLPSRGEEKQGPTAVTARVAASPHSLLRSHNRSMAAAATTASETKTKGISRSAFSRSAFVGSAFRFASPSAPSFAEGGYGDGDGPQRTLHHGPLFRRRALTHSQSGAAERFRTTTAAPAQADASSAVSSAFFPSRVFSLAARHRRSDARVEPSQPFAAVRVPAKNAAAAARQSSVKPAATAKPAAPYEMQRGSSPSGFAQSGFLARFSATVSKANQTKGISSFVLPHTAPASSNGTPVRAQNQTKPVISRFPAAFVARPRDEALDSALGTAKAAARRMVAQNTTPKASPLLGANTGANSGMGGGVAALLSRQPAFARPVLPASAHSGSLAVNFPARFTAPVLWRRRRESLPAGESATPPSVQGKPFAPTAAGAKATALASPLSPSAFSFASRSVTITGQPPFAPQTAWENRPQRFSRAPLSLGKEPSQSGPLVPARTAVVFAKLTAANRAGVVDRFGKSQRAQSSLSRFAAPTMASASTANAKTTTPNIRGGQRHQAAAFLSAPAASRSAVPPRTDFAFVRGGGLARKEDAAPAAVATVAAAQRQAARPFLFAPPAAATAAAVIARSKARPFSDAVRALSSSAPSVSSPSLGGFLARTSSASVSVRETGAAGKAESGFPTLFSGPRPAIARFRSDNAYATTARRRNVTEAAGEALPARQPLATQASLKQRRAAPLPFVVSATATGPSQAMHRSSRLNTPPTSKDAASWGMLPLISRSFQVGRSSTNDTFRASFERFVTPQPIGYAPAPAVALRQPQRQAFLKQAKRQAVQENRFVAQTTNRASINRAYGTSGIAASIFRFAAAAQADSGFAAKTEAYNTISPVRTLPTVRGGPAANPAATNHHNDLTAARRHISSPAFGTTVLRAAFPYAASENEPTTASPNTIKTSAGNLLTAQATRKAARKATSGAAAAHIPALVQRRFAALPSLGSFTGNAAPGLGSIGSGGMGGGIGGLISGINPAAAMSQNVASFLPGADRGGFASPGGAGSLTLPSVLGNLSSLGSVPTNAADATALGREAGEQVVQQAAQRWLPPQVLPLLSQIRGSNGGGSEENQSGSGSRGGTDESGGFGAIGGFGRALSGGGIGNGAASQWLQNTATTAVTNRLPGMTLPTGAISGMIGRGWGGGNGGNGGSENGAGGAEGANASGDGTQSGASNSKSGVSAAVASGDRGPVAGQVDLLANEVWSLLKRRIAVESERRGRF